MTSSRQASARLTLCIGTVTRKRWGTIWETTRKQQWEGDEEITRYRFLFFARGIQRDVDCVCEKVTENTRGVISEMETRSLACADIKETFLSRKNNMHHARCLLCAHILSNVFNVYITFFYCREENIPAKQKSLLSNDATYLANLNDFIRFFIAISVFSCRLTAVTLSKFSEMP